MKKNLKTISAAKAKIFKIANRRGYAAICSNNLTEGKTTYQAYLRLMKALRRNGYALPKLSSNRISRLVVAKI